jgi:hypothetical protein
MLISVCNQEVGDSHGTGDVMLVSLVVMPGALLCKLDTKVSSSEKEALCSSETLDLKFHTALPQRRPLPSPVIINDEVKS